MAFIDAVQQLIVFLEGITNPDFFYRQTIVLDGSKWETLEWKEIPTMTPYHSGKCRYILHEVMTAMGIGDDIRLCLHANVDSAHGTQLWLGFEPREPLKMEFCPWFKLSLSSPSARGVPSLELKVGVNTSGRSIALPGVYNPENLKSRRLEFKVLACLMPSTDEDCGN